MRGDAYADEYSRLGKPHRGAWRSDSESDYTRDAILAGVVVSMVCRSGSERLRAESQHRVAD